VIACSNSEAALHLDDEDRRWFVPTVAETLKPPEWWQAFYSWFEGEGAGSSSNGRSTTRSSTAR
jgi:hypothetical protein